MLRLHDGNPSTHAASCPFAPAGEPRSTTLPIGAVAAIAASWDPAASSGGSFAARITPSEALVGTLGRPYAASAGLVIAGTTRKAV